MEELVIKRLRSSGKFALEAGIMRGYTMNLYQSNNYIDRIVVSMCAYSGLKLMFRVKKKMKSFHCNNKGLHFSDPGYRQVCTQQCEKCKNE